MPHDDMTDGFDDFDGFLVAIGLPRARPARAHEGPVMGEKITITITADEDDLRDKVQAIRDAVDWIERRLDDTDWSEDTHAKACAHIVRLVVVADAIAAALPKPRITVKPGMVLRHKSSGKRFAYRSPDGGWMLALGEGWSEFRPPAHGLDPDEWEVLLDAEDGAT